MTLSSYKVDKIIGKWNHGEEIKTIAREEKVCAETVRRYLEKYRNQTGYKRGCGQEQISKQNKNERKFKDQSSSQNSSQIKNASPDIDHVCSLLEGMMQQEDKLRTTLIDSDSFDISQPNQSLLMKQLVDEIKDIHGQLAEFREELNKMQSSVKK